MLRQPNTMIANAMINGANRQIARMIGAHQAELPAAHALLGKRWQDSCCPSGPETGGTWTGRSTKRLSDTKFSDSVVGVASPEYSGQRTDQTSGSLPADIWARLVVS